MWQFPSKSNLNNVKHSPPINFCSVPLSDCWTKISIKKHPIVAGLENHRASNLFSSMTCLSKRKQQRKIPPVYRSRTSTKVEFFASDPETSLVTNRCTLWLLWVLERHRRSPPPTGESIVWTSALSTLHGSLARFDVHLKASLPRMCKKYRQLSGRVLSMPRVQFSAPLLAYENRIEDHIETTGRQNFAIHVSNNSAGQESVYPRLASLKVHIMMWNAAALTCGDSMCLLEERTRDKNQPVFAKHTVTENRLKWKLSWKPSGNQCYASCWLAGVAFNRGCSL